MFQGCTTTPPPPTNACGTGCWSGDLAYRDADGWIYLAGRTADWMRVDRGEPCDCPRSRRILLRKGNQSKSVCTRYPMQRRRPGDGRGGSAPAELTPGDSKNSWPRSRTCPKGPSALCVWLTDRLPPRPVRSSNALVAMGSTRRWPAWVRDERGTAYRGDRRPRQGKATITRPVTPAVRWAHAVVLPGSAGIHTRRGQDCPWNAQRRPAFWGYGG